MTLQRTPVIPLFPPSSSIHNFLRTEIMMMSEFSAFRVIKKVHDYRMDILVYRKPS